jgi:hypothetical protein
VGFFGKDPPGFSNSHELEAHIVPRIFMVYAENSLNTRHFSTDSFELKRREPHPSFTAGSRQRTEGSSSLAENKKLHCPSIEEGVELSQRTDQLSFVPLLGRGTREIY